MTYQVLYQGLSTIVLIYGSDLLYHLKATTTIVAVTDLRHFNLSQQTAALTKTESHAVLANSRIVIIYLYKLSDIKTAVFTLHQPTISVYSVFKRKFMAEDAYITAIIKFLRS
ncbi:hypothetical protein BIY29_14975 [Brenneria alni]|uniref:Uncharacterized protein n=1 Tax=Brenneria alni TaxID=71656 RepID=A0A421DL24_9GAMM|nr:hypothetical protein BIY29_14975 [Brenneria alni]